MTKGLQWKIATIVLLVVALAAFPRVCAAADDASAGDAPKAAADSGLYIKVQLAHPIKMSRLKAGDVVELKEKSKGIVQIQQTLAALEKRGFPSWLEIDKVQFKGKVLSLPARDECTLPTVKEQLVVEIYSK